jgi:hypothetical protein
MTTDRDALVKLLNQCLDADQDSPYVRLAHKTVREAIAALTAQGGETADTSPGIREGMLMAVKIGESLRDAAYARSANAQKFNPRDPAYYSSHQEGIAAALSEFIEAIRAAVEKEQTADTVSVPREPTEAMVGAYVRAVSECKAPTWYEAIRAGYAAMLAAAKEGKS